ncbi:MAG: diphthine synthase [Candidatus Pacearchaeota archaeon]
MLYLIGLGLDKKDISLKAIEAIRSCKHIYWETYTNVYNYSQKDIEKVIGKKIIPVDRKIVEEGKEILENAKNKKIGLLVSGDPLAATTHVDLLLRARKMKIKTKVIHAPSIFTAIADSGLQLYKFGKTASIAKWNKSFRPDSFYEVIKRNDEIEAHTLLLIDIGLQVSEALGYLDTIAKSRDPGMLERKIIVCEQLGTNKQKFTIGKIPVLINKKFKLPACIIIPGKLHFMEEEFLKELQ